VEAEQGRPDDRGDVNHGPDRDDGALLVANRKLLDVLLAQAELRIRLHIDLEDSAEFVELVDVARAQIGPERRDHLVDRHRQRLGLGAVHLDLELRHGGTERARHPLQPALRWASLITVFVVVCSLVRSKLPSRSSSCMAKPAALPMPWIGGGGNTTMRACSITAKSRLNCWNSERKSSPLPRSLQSLSTT